jgi:flagellin
MSLNSINTNVAALRAQENIGAANRSSSSSIARLSSGERIVRAADDVASMSAGTSLRTNVTTLRTALINTSQGSSMLQVADGALSEITDILLRQKAIAVQAGSGSLSASERSFLDQEFQNLTQEVDRLAEQTNFNGVNLLDGSLFDKTEVANASSGAANGFVTLSVSDPATITSLQFEDGLGNQVNITAVGATSEAIAGSVANQINADATLSQIFQADVDGGIVTVTARGGGSAASGYSVTAATAADWQIGGEIVTDNAGAAIAGQFSFIIPDETGLDSASVTATGTIGDSIINTHQQDRAFYSLTFAEVATAFVGETIIIDDGAGGNLTLTGPAAPLTRPDGTNDYEATVDALVNTFNDYAGAGGFVADQLEARREGLTFIIEKINPGAAFAADGDAVIAIAGTLAANGGVSAGGSTTLANNVNTGIGLEGITNSAFVGTVSGFSAEFQSANLVDLSITVGERTYELDNVNTAADATLRLFSNEGDYLDIDFQGATSNIVVSNQAQADTVAARLDTAFEAMTFNQSRDVTSYQGSGDIVVGGQTRGTLSGTTVELQLSDFADVEIQDVSVNAPPAGGDNAVIEFTINGEVYRSDLPLSDELGANSVYQFIGTTNGNNVLTFRTGDVSPNAAAGSGAIEINNAQDAAALETALKKAFGIGEGEGQTVSFQVGTTTADSLEIVIGTVTTEAIYAGQSLNVLTQDAAGIAGDALSVAIDAVTSVRAEVGALQSRFDFASSNIESSLQNQDAARGVLLDTDIAAESTMFATAQVKLQAGISVLAQANLLSQNLLKLIG